MLGTLLAALVLAAPNVAVRVEEARDVRADEIDRLTGLVTELIRASDRNVEVWAEQSEQTVLALSLEGAPAKIRIIAELKPSEPKKKLILDVPRDDKTWRDALTPMVLDYFPPPPKKSAKSAPAAALTAPVLDDSKPELVPWVAVGTSILAGSTGTLLLLSRANVRDRMNDGELAPDELTELQDDADERRLGGMLLIGTAVVSAGVAAVWWMLD